MKANIRKEEFDNVFRYGGFEHNVDLTDYKQLEQYEKAIESFKNSAPSIDNMEEGVEKIKAFFQAIAQFFDNMFGENTSNLMFGESASLNMAKDAYMQFLDFVKLQKEYNEKKTLEFNNKIKAYAPKK